jgi:hypothetical protein
VQEKKKPLPLNNIVSKKARDVWARHKELIKEENKKAITALKQSETTTKGNSEILPSTGFRLQAKVQAVAHDLVGNVARESLYRETIAVPGKPFIDKSIEEKSSKQLRIDFEAWLEWICPEDQKPNFSAKFKILLKPCRERAMPLRFFTAFFHLKPDLGEVHNLARFNLLMEWLSIIPIERLQVYVSETLDNFVWKMFHQWHDAMESMRSKRTLTEEEEILAQIIARRLEIIRHSARMFSSQQRENHPWERIFEMESDPIDLNGPFPPIPESVWVKLWKKEAKKVPEDYFEKLKESDPRIVDILEFEPGAAVGLDLENNDRKKFEEGIKRLKEEEEAKGKEREAKKAARETMKKIRKAEMKAAKKTRAQR